MAALVPRRRSAWLAWSLWALTGAAYGASLVLGILDPSAGTEVNALLVAFSLFVLVFSTVGALVASRQPRNPVGWILSASALAYAAAGAALSYADYSFHTRAGLPGAVVAQWLASWMFGLGFLGPTFTPLLFPDGRALSPRWRAVGWVAGVSIVMLLGGIALMPGVCEGCHARNPFGLEGATSILNGVEGIGGTLLLAAVLASVVSVVVRFRRARGEKRQQIKWLAFAALFVGVFVVAGTIIGNSDLGSERVVDFGNLIVTTSATAIPVCMGIAILRYRLYDIDLIINRTLVYVSLTGLLGAAYVLSVILLGRLLNPITENNQLAVAASTLAVAAAFRPARARVQAFIDRRFYRAKYDAARTIEEFSARVRNEVDLDALTRHLLDVVRQTMRPGLVSLWLRREDRHP